MIKEMINKKVKNKNKGMNRFMHKKHFNMKKIFKSTVFTLTLLSLIMSQVLIFPINSYADTVQTQKYRYVFDFGCDERGTPYYYEIITEEPMNQNTVNEYNITVKSIKFNNSPSSIFEGIDPSLDVNKNTLYDYIRGCLCREGSYSYDEDEADETYLKAVDLARKLTYCMIDYKCTTDNKCIIYHHSDDAEKVYLSGAASGDAYQDGKYGWMQVKYNTDPLNWGWSKKDWNAWNEFQKTGYSPFNQQEDMSSRFYYMMKDGAGESKQSVEAYLKQKSCVCYLITRHIQEAGNAFGFTKIKYDEPTPSLGRYSYEPDMATLDEKNATIDIKVYLEIQNAKNTKLNGKNYVYTFRYTKGGETNVTSGKFAVAVGTGEIGDRNKMNKPNGEFNLYPRIEGGKVIDPLDNYYRQDGTTSDGTPIYRYDKGTCFFEEFTQESTWSNYIVGITHAFCAIKNGSNVDFISGQRWVVPEESDSTEINFEPYLTKGMANGSLFTSAGNYYGYHEYTTCFSIPMADLDNLFKKSIKAPDGDKKYCGNWTLVWDKTKQKLVAYNENLKDGEAQLYFVMPFTKTSYYGLNFSKQLHDGDAFDEDYDFSTRLHFSMNEDETDLAKVKNCYKFYDTGSSHSSNYAAVLYYTIKHNDELNEAKLESDNLHLLIKSIAKEPNQKIYLSFYDYTKETDSASRGMPGGSSTIKIDTKTKLVTETQNNRPVQFDITDWIKELFPEEIEEEEEDDSNPWGIEFLDEAELLENEQAFLKALLRYAKPIIMFLILLAIIYTGIFSILHNQDAKQRVLVKERLKHIVIGVMVFASVAAIIMLAKMLMDSSFKMIEEVAETEVTIPFDVPAPEADTNWAVKLLTSFINVIGDIFEWAINSILSVVIGGSAGTDLNYVIFNRGVAESDYDLSPFTKTEWKRYMYGYQALESLALALLAIAIIKLAIELITHAGSSEKMAETKQTVLRVCAAMLAIVLGPYAVRLCLMLFNYLIKLIPVKSLDLELQFQDTGILGASATCIYAWTKFQIYLAFVVRKLMITFMLLVTPVVFGLWAISDKFRSLNLWVGELVSNCATQFCYALVFFIAGLIMVENQSDFVSLIIILMLMKLADFFKDSLQGLVQKWGGIDETGTAQKLAGTMQSWGKKTINTTKKVAGKTGGVMVGVANYVDPNQVGTGTRILRNAGSILQNRNIWGVQTKAQQYKNLGKVLDSKKREEQGELGKLDHARSMSDRTDYNEAYDRARSGEMTQEELEEYRDKAGFSGVYEAGMHKKKFDRYDQARKDAKSIEGDSRHLYENAAKKREDKMLDTYSSPNDRYERTDFYNAFHNSQEKLAQQSGDLDITKKLHEMGKVDDKALIKSCSDLLKDANTATKDGHNANMSDDFINTLNQQIRDQIEDAMSQISENNETKDFKQLQERFESFDGQIKAQGPVKEIVDEMEISQKEAFDKIKKERKEALNKTFGIKN